MKIFKLKIVKDVSWNYVAYIIPMLVAVPVFGVIARLLEVERFGLYTLIFTMFGYASVFDLGFSRALVRCISINRTNSADVKKYLISAVYPMALISALPLSLMFRFSGEVVELINVSKLHYLEVVESFEIAALIFPVIMITSMWQAYLEGNERFKELSVLKVVSDLSLSLIPLFFILFEPELLSAVKGILLARVLSLVIHVGYIYPEIRRIDCSGYSYEKTAELFRYGGWLTLTNIISPLLTTFDRFVLSAVSGSDQVAFYTAPSEIISRLLLIPGIIAKTIFPRLARHNDLKFKSRINLISSFIVLLMVVVLFFCSGLIIEIWLGDGYSDSLVTLKILLIGLFFFGAAQVPYISIQAEGNSKIIAFVHFLEVVPYLLLLYFLIQMYSYKGAAIAWSIRSVVDYAAFSFIDRRYGRKMIISE